MSTPARSIRPAPLRASDVAGRSTLLGRGLRDAALPATSRPSQLGFRRHLHMVELPRVFRSDGAKLGVLAAGASPQERAQLNVRQPAARRSIRLMDHKGSAVLRLASEIPRISFRASVQFSPLGHWRTPAPVRYKVRNKESRGKVRGCYNRQRASRTAGSTLGDYDRT